MSPQDQITLCAQLKITSLQLPYIVNSSVFFKL